MDDNPDRSDQRPRPHVEVFARPSAPHLGKKLQGLVDQLETFADSGRIDGYDIHFWEGRVQDTDAGPRTPECIQWYRRFETVATQHGWSLTPAFEHARRHSTFADEDYDEYVFPVLALAVHVADSIVDIAPRKDGDEYMTVDDCLRELERPDSRSPERRSEGMEISP